MLSGILLAIFLVLLNGFFVAAEFALVKVRLSQLELKATQGSNIAKISKHLVEHLDAYLSATQLGITLASLALGWIGERMVSKIVLQAFLSAGLDVNTHIIHAAAFPATFALIAVMHIVFGELAPKSIAIRHPLNTILTLSIPLRIFYFIFMPFIWLLNRFASLIIRLMGVKPIYGSEIHTEEELRLLLAESEEGGAIKPSQHELIQNVFEFDDRVVKQIYIPRTKVSAINIALSGHEIIDFVVQEGYSRLPVYRESVDNIIGVIYTKDLLRVIKDQNFKGVENILRPAYYVPLNKKINELLREFQQLHIQMAIVTNEFGGTEGIVTMEDIIEELVGEIQDEYDEEKPVVERISETEFIVNALSAISDVNDYLPVPLPESDEYDTVSGLMNFIFGRIPAVKETKVFEGYEFTILKRFKHSVDTVKMKVREEQSL